jgi:signal transduction histidine kinase
MRIRNKLFIYFGLLLMVAFAISVLLATGVLRYAMNRLLYSNVYELNRSIVQSIEQSSVQELLEKVELVHELTGVEIIVSNQGVTIYSSFDESTLDLTKAVLVSERYQVYRVNDQQMLYYFTEAFLEEGAYQVYVFRTADLTITNTDEIFYTSFIGIIFLGLAVPLLSLLTARVFSHPVQELTEYASQLAPESQPKPKPRFRITEYNDLSAAMEDAANRLRVYRQKEQEFLHNFSHEMKTPLTNIYGFAEAIQYGVTSPDETKNACQIIMNESEKLKDNINQIMLLGRLDSVNQVYRMQKVNLKDLLSDSLNSIQIQATSNNLKLVFPDIEDNVFVFGDPEKLEAAFVNILSNAVRYAKTMIRIEVLVQTSNIEVRIDDDGIGIPVEERDKVFERYYIGYKGHTGLGLTITKTIFDRHQIKVEIDSSPEAGARFRIVFPGVLRQHRPGQS